MFAYYIMFDWDILLKLNDVFFLGRLRVAALHQVIQQGGNACRVDPFGFGHI